MINHKVFERLNKRFCVRRVTENDFGALVDFFIFAYKDQYNASRFVDKNIILQRIVWNNLKNPFCNNRDALPSWICLFKDKIVGHFGSIPIMIKRNDNIFSSAWGRDLIVAPEYRNKGIGPLLINTVLNEKNNSLCFLIAGLNDKIYPVYKKLDFYDFGTIPQFIKILNFGSIAALITKKSIFHKGVLKIAKSKLFTKKNYRLPKYKKEIEFRILKDFNDDDKYFLDRVRNNFFVSMVKNASFLKWRYFDQPEFSYDIIRLTIKDKIKGYLVLRVSKVKGLNCGNIVDIIYDNNNQEAKNLLLNFSINFFKEINNIAFVRYGSIKDKYNWNLLRYGFVSIPSSSRFMAFFYDRSLENNDLTKNSNWQITYGDSDIDLS